MQVAEGTAGQRADNGLTTPTQFAADQDQAGSIARQLGGRAQGIGDHCHIVASFQETCQL